MQKLTALPEWSRLHPLLEFRNRIILATRDPASREVRPDGRPGRLRLSVRKALLEELLRLQDSLGLQLIADEEVKVIRSLWENPRYRGYGNVDRSGPHDTRRACETQ